MARAFHERPDAERPDIVASRREAARPLDRLNRASNPNTISSMLQPPSDWTQRTDPP
jgi:hypothetical protein